MKPKNACTLPNSKLSPVSRRCASQPAAGIRDGRFAACKQFGRFKWLEIVERGAVLLIGHLGAAGGDVDWHGLAVLLGVYMVLARAWWRV